MRKSILLFFISTILSCSGKARQENHHKATPENNKEIACFIYHRFGDSRFPSTNVSVKDFEAHLSFLADNGFQVLTLSAALEYLHSNSPSKKTAVITVDDAFKSFYTNGLPLLKKYGMPTTLFINTKTVGGSDYMTWPQLQEAMKANIEIGNHTHSHNYFLNEPVDTRYAAFEKDIQHCQTIIKQNLKITPTVFAYPYGEFDDDMKSIVKKAGFKCAAAQNSGVLHSGTDLYQLPRFPMAEAYADPAKFAEKTGMRPIKIISQSPGNSILPGDEPRPSLTLTFNSTDLNTTQLQCFVQGGECNLKILDKTDNQMTITIHATNDLSLRRRTLYTITIPDKTGAWHWYSHLWVNNKVK